MKAIVVVSMIMLLPLLGWGQQKISLHQAIDMAVQNSLTTQRSRLQLEGAQREYDLLKKEYLPTLQLATTAPVFSKTTSRITVPSGEDVFVNQNQIFNDFSLGIKVAEPLFNGNFEITSRMNRLDILGNSENLASYYSVPISIAYSNDNLLFNEFKWKSKVAELDLGIEQRRLEQSYNQISVEVVELFFDHLTAANELASNQRQQTELQQLATMARERLRLGTVDRSEVLSLEVELLEIANDLEQAQLDHYIQKQELTQLLGTSTFVLDTAFSSLLPANIPQKLEYQSLYVNTLEYLELERDRVILEQDLAKTKTNDLFSVNVNGSFGLSNTGAEFSQSVTNLVDQQRYSVSLNWTIFDFGKRRDKLKILDLEQQSLQMQLTEQSTDFELEVQALINKANNNYSMLLILREAGQIAQENYANLLERFRLGKVDVQTLIDARRKGLDIHNKYLSNLKSYWMYLFELREKTNYDFSTGTNVVH